MSRKSLHAIGFGFALTLALGACASASKQEGPTPEPTTAQVTVTVQNNYSADMAIYVVNPSGGHTRIGTAMQASRSQFVIPAELLTTSGLRMVAKEIGPGTGYIFPRIAIQPADRLDLVLESNLTYSSAWVR